jgi:hypothetical protein
MSRRNSEADTLALILLIVLIPFEVALRGFVLARLWTWFMVPLGVISIGTMHAIGIAVLLTMFNVAKGSKDNNDEKSAGEVVMKAIIVGLGGPLMFWFFGWIIQCFM